MTKHNGMAEWAAAEAQAEAAHPSGIEWTRYLDDKPPGGWPHAARTPVLLADERATLAALAASPAGAATTKAVEKITDIGLVAQAICLSDLAAKGLVRYAQHRDETVWNDTPAARAAMQHHADLHPETPSTEIPVSDPRRSSRTEYSRGVAAQAIAENDDLARFPDLARQAVINCCADWEAGSGPGDLYSFAQGWAAGYARS